MTARSLPVDAAYIVSREWVPNRDSDFPILECRLSDGASLEAVYWPTQFRLEWVVRDINGDIVASNPRDAGLSADEVADVGGRVESAVDMWLMLRARAVK